MSYLYLAHNTGVEEKVQQNLSSKIKLETGIRAVKERKGSSES